MLPHQEVDCSPKSGSVLQLSSNTSFLSDMSSVKLVLCLHRIETLGLQTARKREKNEMYYIYLCMLNTYEFQNKENVKK